MKFRFRKRIKIAPGISINLSKSGISTTIGGHGASINLGKNGTHLNAGIPGTGIYTRQKLSFGGNKNDGQVENAAQFANVDQTYSDKPPKKPMGKCKKILLSISIFFVVLFVLAVIGSRNTEHKDVMMPISSSELSWFKIGETINEVNNSKIKYEVLDKSKGYTNIIVEKLPYTDWSADIDYISVLFNNKTNKADEIQIILNSKSSQNGEPSKVYNKYVDFAKNKYSCQDIKQTLVCSVDANVLVLNHLNVNGTAVEAMILLTAQKFQKRKKDLIH